MNSTETHELSRYFGKKKMSEIAAYYTNNQLEKVIQAYSILRAIGLDKKHHYSIVRTDRSAWVLLALANISSSSSWSDATSSPIGIDAIMNFIRENYSFTYAPNSRESIRKDCLHTFLHLRMVNENEDNPNRATNSSDYNYSLTSEFLNVLRSFDQPSWETSLQQFLGSIEGLQQLWLEKTESMKIKVEIPDSPAIHLSPGEHNQLQADIVHKFCREFVSKNYSVLYLGDTDKTRNSGGKLLHMDTELFSALNIQVLDKGKLPDVIIYDHDKSWLFLVEAVTSTGAISTKRHSQLEQLFSGCNVGIVYVTAFPNKQTLRKFIVDIAWETEVWVAENPNHMIHLNGDRFLGPHT
ncbi:MULTISPECIES: BsuBI/PstI family type II restriction endonuclease [Vibrio harveyi group]|uniref:BsuBI/PstI family type II restriction endonuclease n=1 Tax=Vibrio harveyi group TaxID=717610 RepID=UPI00215BE9D4|nr:MULTISPECIES: BsuBI/PstI family type II restriction endonuclease [Vibrio harveyi group]MCR9560473.1 restriction endonuclease [Vibrio alginolyticus]MCS0387315.1 restriction endonuclease [Vibrio diabolicus]